MESTVRQSLAGWGNYPLIPTAVARPERIAELQALVTRGGDTPRIARGLGRSYGDAAVAPGGTTVAMTRFNRLLALEEDGEGGLLLTCEAGLSLAEVITHLLPRGYFPPVTPGTKFVTVGGAIANDVHGKNHHVDGSFATAVQRFRLLTPEGELLSCSRQEHPDLFWATLGGLGLTGVILEATWRLRAVPSAYLRVEYLRTSGLEETIQTFVRTDAAARYSVAWIDCLASGRAMGRAVVMNGDHAAPEELAPTLRQAPWRVRSPRPLAVPFPPPFSLITAGTTSLFNALYYAAHPSRQVLVDYDRFFYPLDAVHHWNRVYGRRGFVQCQAVFPEEEGPAALQAMLQSLRSARKPSFLAVLKRTGEASGGLLSFPRRGWTLAVDIPVTADLPAFMDRLHAQIADYGGRVYLAKDATLRPALLRRMYPNLERFLAIKERVDPHGRLQSALSRRLGLGGGAR